MSYDLYLTYKRAWVPRMRKGLFLKYLICSLFLGWTLSFAAEISLAQNRPPVFDPVAVCFVSEPPPNSLGSQGGYLGSGTYATCYVREGESLEVYVRASDPDGDSIGIFVLNAPQTAWFGDLGGGEASLLWAPDYVGPGSSAQSPFELFFVASDGTLSSRLRVLITVINVNRNPELIFPESLNVAAGSELVFQVRASDPDFEEVAIHAVTLPPEAVFEEESGVFSWTPQLADTGSWPISFRAVDLSGGDCYGQAQVEVTAPLSFSLGVGVETALLGGVVSVPINLVNPVAVAGMELLIQFDPTVFQFLGVSRQGTRIEDWEYFTYREKTWALLGQIKILGIADFPNQIPATPIPPDSGAIAYVCFRVTSDPHLDGLLAPLEFFWFDYADNTLSTPRGRFITQEMINVNNGGVLLSSGSTLIGDVNTNGLAFEVGDAVKLASYITGLTTLNEQQLINSDINGDGRFATLLDLALLINQILEGGNAPEAPGDGPDQVAEVRITKQSYQSMVWLDSDIPAGGALVIFRGEKARVENVKLAPEAKGLELYTSEMGDQFKVLIVSRETEPLPAGESYLFSYEGEGFDTVQVCLADQEGQLLAVKQEYESSSLPKTHSLYQNYPNPFNPSTSIRYSVGGDSPVQVSLRVYNVAGQLVRSLVDEKKFPGEYREIWDGKNENNQEVSSGMYFYKLKVSDYGETKKMVLLR